MWWLKIISHSGHNDIDLETHIKEQDEIHSNTSMQELELALSIFFEREDKVFLTAFGFYNIPLNEKISYSYATHHFSFIKQDGSSHTYIKSPRNEKRYFAIDEEIKINGSKQIIFKIQDCIIVGNKIRTKELYHLKVYDERKKPQVYSAILKNLISLDHTERIN